MAHDRSHTTLFIGIFVILLILVGLTVEAARHDLGRWNFPVAVLIAVVKAFLIAYFFMHVGESRSLTKLVVVAGLLWLAIMFTFSLSDYWSRPWQTTSHVKSLQSPDV